MKNITKKITAISLAAVLALGMGVTAFADDNGSTSATSTSGNMYGDVDLYYTVTHENDYTDVSGVKLTWSVPILQYNEKDVRTWDTETLQWHQVYEYTNEQDVSFKFVNRGSEEVIASVSYESLTEGASSVTFTDNNPVLSTIVNADKSLKATEDKADYVEANCSATVTGKVKIDDASKVADGSGKLGTYTVSIRSTKHTVTVMYYKNADDSEMTTETITVDDGATITYSGTTVTIGATSYTTAVPSKTAFSDWGSTISTVTADLTLKAYLMR